VEALAKQLQNSDSKVFSIMHALVTANIFEILQMLPGICLTYRIKCYPSILVWVVQNPSMFLGNVQWNVVIHMKNSDYIVFHNVLSLPMYFDFLQMFPNVCDI